MRILHFESFFHPDAGYQLNILAKYMVRMGHDVEILTGQLDKFPDYLCSFFGKDNIDARDNEYEKKYGVKIIRIPLDWYKLRQAYINRRFKQEVEAFQPDVVFAHGNDDLNSIRMINYCIKRKIPVVSDTHMADVASVSHFSWAFHMFYRVFCTPSIRKHGIYVIKTANIDYVNRHYGIDEVQTPWISFGSDMMLFHPDSVEKKEGRAKFQILEKDIVGIYAGKLDEYKGGMLLAETVKEKFSKNVVFLVIGNTVGDYGKKVEEEFSKTENRVIRIPTQRYEDLARYFKIADFALIPRQTSLSFYDYQATGLPVISENIQINDERTKYDNGLLFESGSKEQLRKAIETYLNMEQESRRKMSENAINYVKQSFDYEKKCEEYMEILTNTVKRMNKE